MTNWISLVASEQVRPHGITAASDANVKIVLLKVDGDVVAYEDKCPHEDYPLRLADLDDGVLTCAKHLWEFDAKTGLNLSGDANSSRNLVRFPVRIVEGMVEVDVASPSRAQRSND